jgi:hypothetical protein
MILTLPTSGCLFCCAPSSGDAGGTVCYSFDILPPGPAAAKEGHLALSTRHHAHGLQLLLVPFHCIDGGSDPFRGSCLWGSRYRSLSLTGFGLLALLVGRESVLVFCDGFVDVLILVVLLLLLGNICRGLI